ncbi:NADPH-dependent ferric siderophore reductase [Allocatelliglobosispora scoriae]|uniref:NADPH-dependent ferric siderophore reductase n=1 Tax=Allocatelliglobosispora scoriae TaxID=643052 RepID=A0A841BTQ0_9ACTN|nr:siderophore-interacting protein [Allocatelliglobosispora scoriae]MBB5872457.1 NADPH-dependent ferric siderophore reductase [Allocatelliglobosispora scoriae]
MKATLITPFRLFRSSVARIEQLSPTFRRVTLVGPELVDFADNGYDQRIKVILPVAGSGRTGFPTTPDWYAAWRALPPEHRSPIRTYTARAVRRDLTDPALSEVDIDFALHGEAGPASRWALNARVGDELALLGPNAAFDGEHGGVEFRPPATATNLLFAGDETAVPAIASILERLPETATGRVLLEVPSAADEIALIAPEGMTIRWLARDGGEPGCRLTPAVMGVFSGTVSTGPADDFEEDDADLWEVPEAVPLGTDPTTVPYAWLAGESGVIKALRRYLVGELGLDRKAVAFMGYWRLGRSEGAEV